MWSLLISHGPAAHCACLGIIECCSGNCKPLRAMLNCSSWKVSLNTGFWKLYRMRGLFSRSITTYKRNGQTDWGPFRVDYFVYRYSDEPTRSPVHLHRATSQGHEVISWRAMAKSEAYSSNLALQVIPTQT